VFERFSEWNRPVPEDVVEGDNAGSGKLEVVANGLIFRAVDTARELESSILLGLSQIEELDVVVEIAFWETAIRVEVQGIETSLSAVQEHLGGGVLCQDSRVSGTKPQCQTSIDHESTETEADMSHTVLGTLWTDGIEVVGLCYACEVGIET
jgi:hypothetical protein